MRTMAGFVFFSVIVACSLQQVFAIDCLMISIENIRNCNDCIRCGGYWCISGEKQHCSSTQNDNWCSGANNREELPSIPQRSVAGAAISPSFWATTAAVDRESPRIMFKHNKTVTLGQHASPKVDLTVINSTQRQNFETAELYTECGKSGVCTTHLSIKPMTDFCLDDGGKYEFLNMRVRVENLTEEATVQFHVPCACSCSDEVEKNAARCSGHGDFSCGVCICHRGWAGEKCDNRPKCENRRGDVQCTNPYKNQVTCSGNGVCGECDTCICYEHGEGSQYFDPDNFCADLGLVVTSECETCLHDAHITEGQCPECSAIMQLCNETLLAERDDQDRAVWVQFEDSFDGAEYAAMKDSTGQIYIMRKSSCVSIFNPLAGNVNVTIPTVLGVLAVVAMATVAAGYMVWKARAAPPPLHASQYQELDGPENSTNINPIYKSPTSSYNNPLWKGGAKV